MRVVVACVRFRRADKGALIFGKASFTELVIDARACDVSVLGGYVVKGKKRLRHLASSRTLALSFRQCPAVAR
eukprot:1123298-Amphidinium_carterae.2